MPCSGNFVEKAACAAANPLGPAAGAAQKAVGSATHSVISGGLSDIAHQLASGATDLLKALASWFVSGTTINLAHAGLTTPLDDIAGLAMIVAFVLLIVAAGQAGMLGTGRPLGTALAGLAKAVVIWIGIVAVVALLLDVADGLTRWIITQGFTTQAGFENKLTGLFATSSVQSDVGLLFIIALVALFVTLALWLEMVFRALGIVLLVAGSPMAAVGLMHDSTASWWPRTRTALLNLIFLKPVIALVFLVAFGLFGNSTGVFETVVGVAGLLLAGIAWPVLASYLTFTSTKPGLGLAGSLVTGIAGFAAGRATGAAAGGGAGGMSPVYDAAAVEAAADANHAEITAGRTGRSWLAGANSASGVGMGGLAGAGAGGGGGLRLAAAGGAALADTAVSHMQAMHGHAGLGPGGNTNLHVPYVPRTGPGSGDGRGSPGADGPSAGSSSGDGSGGGPGPRWPGPEAPTPPSGALSSRVESSGVESPTMNVSDEAGPTGNGSTPGPPPSEPPTPAREPGGPTEEEGDG